MSRAYLAGPMTEKPQYNFASFDRARDKLKEMGWDVVSPADMDRAQGFDPIKNPDQKPLDRKACMHRDMEALQTCDAIVLLAGWEASPGALKELRFAQKLGLGVYEYVEFGNEAALVRRKDLEDGE